MDHQDLHESTSVDHQNQDESIDAAFLLNHQSETSLPSSWPDDILDSGASIHVFNDIARFQNFTKASKIIYIQAGSSRILILGYGSVRIPILREDKSEGVMRLSNVAYCVDFVVNLVSFQQLRKRDIYWDTERNVLYKKANKGRRTICLIHQVDELPAFQRSDSSSKAALLITPILRRRSGKPRSSSKEDRCLHLALSYGTSWTNKPSQTRRELIRCYTIRAIDHSV